MSDLNAFVLETPRPLPVILLLDCSSSMSGTKIDALNAAVRELTQELAATKQPQGEVHLATISFGAHIDRTELVPASEAQLPPLSAGGMTPMGAALDELLVLLEDRDKLPSRAYTPTLVLISDGQPTDHFDKALTALLESPRGKRATRLALAIGDDADTGVLKRFVNHAEIPVIRAKEVSRIRDFFRWVTYSVQARSKSRSPDTAQVISPAMADIPDDDLVF